ncbi:MAG TPA: RuBisCO large subunit C-terminal-like domain-containing protein [Methylocella sp.]|nr:RuBisCO large subunit C-terminal-like domain-containing protein [Methylocella sp.]
MSARLLAFYRIRASAATIEARAQGIANEQSVETPLAAIRDPFIVNEIAGQVEEIADEGNGWFRVRIGLAAATVGNDAGQLLNMLFGNSSLYEDVILDDAVLPPSFAAFFGGPRHGLAGFRARLDAYGRALTASALKPQGLSFKQLAELTYKLALGGIDVIKDDHGLANQAFSPFAERVKACAEAARKAMAAAGKPVLYVPNCFGHFGEIEEQIALARAEGLSAVMIAPMITGVAALQALRQNHPDFAIIAHPAMIGAGRISPYLFAKLFRLLGADAFVFPNPGGRFAYSSDACLKIAAALRGPCSGLLPGLPVPAGGMTLERVSELLDFYGRDAMLLIGGALLLAKPGKLAEETAAFVRAVRDHRYG